MLPKLPGRSFASKKRSRRRGQKGSGRNRFKQWPLIAKIPAVGCAGVVALFALLLVIGIIGVALDPEEADDRAAETEEQELVVEEPEETKEPEESEEPSEQPTESETPSASPTPTPTPSPT
ncbi:hypothetical protein I2487_03810, partial [Nesterenkonia sp. E16_10]|nr:hypothetical protein [Nesterenkonia sp. E16_10]